jgi:hypothetical protein
MAAAAGGLATCLLPRCLTGRRAVWESGSEGSGHGSRNASRGAAKWVEPKPLPDGTWAKEPDADVIWEPGVEE